MITYEYQQKNEKKRNGIFHFKGPVILNIDISYFKDFLGLEMT